MQSSGTGLLNAVINKLPFELHIPGGYQYCGPGTRLQERLRRGDPGINPLDQACKEHDIAYSIYRELPQRHLADKQLQSRAWQRVKAKDSSIGEKTAALLVSGAMATKTKLGMGLKGGAGCGGNVRMGKPRKKKGGSLPIIPLISLARQIGRVLFEKNKQGSGLDAVRVARRLVKKAGGRKKIRVPRMIPLPKTGGFLPFLLPLFAGLSAVGALGGGKCVTENKAKEF